MNNRIRIARKARKLTQSQLGEKVNLTKNYICLIETGERKPGDRAVSDIARALNVDENWLRTGEGSMEKTSDRESELLATARELLEERDEKFIRLLVDAMMKFDPAGRDWNILERIIDGFVNGAEK